MRRDIDDIGFRPLVVVAIFPALYTNPSRTLRYATDLVEILFAF
jgi:hypothetical protein